MTASQNSPFYDCVVVGAGPSGLIAAIALRQSGFNVRCVGLPPEATGIDRRTTALLQGSVQFLDETLKVNAQLEPYGAALRTLRMIDRTGRLFRAPDMEFEAAELEQESFGYNIPNTDLLRVLFDQLGDDFLPTAGVTGLRLEDSEAHITLREGQVLRAKLVVGADGKKSICRESAGIGTKSWPYDQTAVICNFSHSRPHYEACTEFHFTSGPFTVVPLPGQASALIWTESHRIASFLTAMDDAQFAREISERLGGLLGEITAVEPRAAYPLSILIANRMTGKRVAIVGEAAHAMPPIGAQGLNLGIRDIAGLIECVASARDPGSPEALASYERSRRADVWMRTLAADFLNRTLVSNIPLFQLVRSSGLVALSLPTPLRRMLMRQGMAVADA